MTIRTKINRPITPEEVAVIRTTLERAPVSPEHAALAAAVDHLNALDRCSCGCDSVDFELDGAVGPAKPIGDAIGTTPAGGVVGVIVWGRDDAVTALEIYDLGAGEDGLRLPLPSSIRMFREGAAYMKPIPVFVAAWALAGIGAVLGSIVGNAAGKPGLLAGAGIGGLLGVVSAVVGLTKVRWLPSEDRAGALVGGMIGFAVAAPIAAMNLHTPVTPVLICALAGVGVLLGVGVARGWRQGS